MIMDDYYLDGNAGFLDNRYTFFNGGQVEIREIRAVFYENMIRRELGKRFRKRYTPDEPRLLDSNGNPMFYHIPTPLQLQMHLN